MLGGVPGRTARKGVRKRARLGVASKRGSRSRNKVRSSNYSRTLGNRPGVGVTRVLSTRSNCSSRLKKGVVVNNCFSSGPRCGPCCGVPLMSVSSPCCEMLVEVLVVRFSVVVVVLFVRVVRCSVVVVVLFVRVSQCHAPVVALRHKGVGMSGMSGSGCWKNNNDGSSRRSSCSSSSSNSSSSSRSNNSGRSSTVTLTGRTG